MVKKRNNKMRRCKGCGKNFKPKSPQQFFHNVKCRTRFYLEKNKEDLKIKWKNYYEIHKEQCLETSRKWSLNNPEKRRRINRKSIRKYIENNRDHFNELQRGYYKKHRDKQLSRTKVYKLLRVYKTKIYKLSKYCFICNSRYKTWLFFDIYPLTKENILKALKQNKVRYLCRKHWIEASKKRRLKWLRQQKKKGDI